MSLSSRIDVRIDSILTSSGDLETGTLPLNLRERIDLADGTGAGLANMTWSDTRTRPASGTEDIDLAGSLAGIQAGTTLTFARIKAIYVKAATANTNSVVVTRPAANGVPLFLAASDGISLAPGEVFLWVSPGATGKAVTAATGDLLTVTNSAGSTGVTYDIVVIGASA